MEITKLLKKKKKSKCTGLQREEKETVEVIKQLPGVNFPSNTTSLEM